MAAIALQSLTSAGLVPSTRAAAAGDTITPRQVTDDRCILQVTNGGGSPITVTLTDAGVTPAGSSPTNPTVSVAAGATALIAINPKLANPTTGAIPVGYSATTSVTVAGLAH